MATEPMRLSDAQIKHMAERFLGWRLPDDFNPDGGIKFEPIGNKGSAHEYRHQPVGTNLLTYTQAVAVVRHMAEELPQALPPVRFKPGNYTNECLACGRQFQGAKLSTGCFPCASKHGELA